MISLVPAVMAKAMQGHFIHSFIHLILLGFSRKFRSYARLAGLADSRRGADLIRAAPLHSRKSHLSPEACVVFLLSTALYISP
jgi:hypothetical protein